MRSPMPWHGHWTRGDTDAPIQHGDVGLTGSDDPAYYAQSNTRVQRKAKIGFGTSFAAHVCRRLSGTLPRGPQ